MMFSLEIKGKDQVITEKDQELTGKVQELAGKVQELAGKDRELAAKDVILALIRDKLTDANLRYLVLGDISIRGVVESLEKDSIYLETKLNLRNAYLRAALKCPPAGGRRQSRCVTYNQSCTYLTGMHIP